MSAVGESDDIWECGESSSEPTKWSKSGRFSLITDLGWKNKLSKHPHLINAIISYI